MTRPRRSNSGSNATAVAVSMQQRSSWRRWLFRSIIGGGGRSCCHDKFVYRLVTLLLAVMVVVMSWRRTTNIMMTTTRTSTTSRTSTTRMNNNKNDNGYYTTIEEWSTAASSWLRPSSTTMQLRSRSDDKEEDFLVSRYHNVVNSVLVILVVSRQDDYMIRRVESLTAAFGNNFYVVWDHLNNTACPFELLRAAVSYDHCLDESHQAVSATHWFSRRHKGQERAVMWAIRRAAEARTVRGGDDNRSFKHVWFMEDDVDYYPNVGELVKLVDGTFAIPIDLMHQEKFNNPYDKSFDWFHLNRVLNQTSEYRPFGEYENNNNTMPSLPILRYSMFNLYRLSTAFLLRLDDFYERNGQNWIFFEAMLPTLQMYHQDELSSLLWTDYDAVLKTAASQVQPPQTPLPHHVGSFLRYRPCFTALDQGPGIYHPVKYRNGTYQECHP